MVSDDRHSPAAGTLLPILNTAFGVAVCIGSTVGVGILRTPGEVAGLLNTPQWIAAAWLLGGVYALLCANYVAELATMLPRAGGPYVYARRAFGELSGFIVGFADWSLIAASIAFLAMAFGEYLALLFPRLMSHEPAAGIVVLILFALVNSVGLKAESTTQKFSSLVKALGLLLFVVVCFSLAPDAASSRDAAPVATTFVAVAIALQLIVGTYGGWNAPVYFAEEHQDPARNLPRSLFVGVLLVTAIYLLVNLALMHALTIPQLSASSLPAADALEGIFGGASGKIVTILALACLLSIINAGILTTPRVLVGLSRDHLIPAVISRITSAGVPGIALLMTTAVAVFLVATGTFLSLLAHYAVVTVALNICIAASYFRLRHAEPALSRPFKAWGHPVAPMLAMAVDVALLIGFVVSQTRNTLYTLMMLAAAAPIYFAIRPLLSRSRGS